MKKTIITMMLFVVAITANAQEQVVRFPGVESELVNQLRLMEHKHPSVVMSTPNPSVAAAPVRTTTPKTENGSQQIGYSNPRGTFFLGLDEKGDGTWLSKNGVVGANSDTMQCWIWPNTTVGKYTKLYYRNKMMQDHKSYTDSALYGQNSQGDYLDSITSKGGWEDYYVMGTHGDDGGMENSYSWKFGLPVQYVERADGTKDSFQLLQSATMYDVNNSGFVIGSATSGKSDDGLWPLTQAEPIQRTGLSMEYLEDGQYLFGADMDKMVTKFDRPMAPLYVKSITIAMMAKGYNALTPSKFKFSGLHLEIQDMMGNVLASSEAENTLTEISHRTKKGKLVTFRINQKFSSRKEFLSEGILLSDSFQVVLTGFDHSDLYGMYAAKECTHKSNTFKWDANGQGYSNGYEPYIQLNGIMPRWEYYANFELAKQYGYETGVRGDTIDINFVTALSPYYKYEAHFAGKDYATGSEFDIYSSFTPYDSITRLWQLDIDKPDYIQLSAGYDENVGTEDDPVTLWDYRRLFWLKIYAISTPKVGDYVKIGKAGRYTYFNIVSVDGNTNPDGCVSPTPIRKTLDNHGVVRIVRGETQYNLLGQPINN